MKLRALTRIQKITLSFIVVAVLVAAQMIRIQSSASAKDLSSWASQYGYYEQDAQSDRGNIYDRWGDLLAGNEEVYEVGLELKYVQNPETVAQTLSSVLGIDSAKARGFAFTKFVPSGENAKVYVVTDDFVSAEKIAEIDNLKKQYEKQNPGGMNEKLPSLRGVVWYGHMKRTYPENTVASNILGFYPYLNRADARGMYGIEEKYDKMLSGVKQTIRISLNPYDQVEQPKIPAGTSLILTIDREIQIMTERTLDRALASTGAVNGTIIIENPRNGEILAMAVTPRMDPNQYWNYKDVFKENDSFNKAVNDVYEPGSVFKVLTMASALDTGTVTPTTPFLDTGSITVGGQTIYNWDRGAWGQQDMVGCMRHSLNVCLSWVATQVGPTKFYEYMQRFGIGRRTNIDLAAEAFFPLSVPGDPTWYPVALATNSFGQGIAVSPIEMIQAVSAVANNGSMIAPHLLKAYIQDGQQYNIRPTVVGNPITKKTAQTETEMLSVSLEEESSDALVEGYRVAGKTGTAEIPINGAYSSSLTNASFVGWGPSDDPQFLVYIWLEKPTSSVWGSVVAAPVFRDVVKQLVVLMDIPPDATRLGMKK